MRQGKRNRGDTAGGKAVGAYPRPLLRREAWGELNGEWEFAIDERGRWGQPSEVRFEGRIEVPFAPETPASGVADGGLYRAVWYRRKFQALPRAAEERLVLHFGAVDYLAEVWVNGMFVKRHEGGYTPFSADITDWLVEGEQSVVVRAGDDPAELDKPRGKQDWKLQPHSIWYMRTTGIWQTVWMEVVPACYIEKVRWFPNGERWEIGFEVHLGGHLPEEPGASNGPALSPSKGLKLAVKLSAGGRVLVDDTYGVSNEEVNRQIGLSDPGIDDYRNELLWSPDRPSLIDAELRLQDETGRVIDTVASYTALRSVSILGGRFVLNGKPLQLRLVLSQGYWEESGLTPPDDDALRRDVELVKAMGFNGVRMHQKIECPRFLYWADRLGLLVWEEMPSAYRFTPRAVERITREWTEAVLRDVGHPCIVAWVPINESWGVPDLPDSPSQRHFVQGLYHLTKTLDPSRPVIGNDGWEAAATDIVAIHDYDADVRHIAQRYGSHDETAIEHLLRRETPGHKVLTLEGFEYRNQPIMLTEFGGIAFSDRAGSWGYSRAGSSEEFAEQYFLLLNTVRGLALLSGFCYTQFTDTYQEANGLLYMDRTPKFPIEKIALATRGARSATERELEHRWRNALMVKQGESKE